MRGGRTPIGPTLSGGRTPVLSGGLLPCWACLRGWRRGHRLGCLPFRCHRGRAGGRFFLHGFGFRLSHRLLHNRFFHHFRHRRLLIRGKDLRRLRFNHRGFSHCLHRRCLLHCRDFLIIVRHCPGLGLLTQHLLLLLVPDALLLLFFLPEELRFLLFEHLQHNFSVALDPFRFGQDHARLLIEFLDCVFQPDFSH